MRRVWFERIPFPELTPFCGSDVDVIWPDNPCVNLRSRLIYANENFPSFTVISRGAALSQMASAAEVVRCSAPKHCGFRELDHARPGERGYSASGQYYRNVMQWWMRKGEDLNPAGLTKSQYCRRFCPNPSEELKVTDVLYECLLHDASHYFNTSVYGVKVKRFTAGL